MHMHIIYVIGRTSKNIGIKKYRQKRFKSDSKMLLKKRNGESSHIKMINPNLMKIVILH